jgi:hypothetical protein
MPTWRNAVARQLVAFLVIGINGVLGGVIGVAFAAFLVTAAKEGSTGVDDLARRSVRWRVPVR